MKKFSIIAIFLKLPHPLKTLVFNLNGLKNYRARFSNFFHRYLSIYKKNWTSPIEEINAFQRRELLELLVEVNEYSPYYKHSLKSIDFGKLDSYSNSELLKIIPILTKANLRENLASILNRNNNRKIVYTSKTSGTTGTPIVSYYDKESMSKAFALWKRFHYSIGITKKFPKNARFSGNMLFKDTEKNNFWLKNYFENQMYFSVYHLSSKNLEKYISKLNKFKPEIIDGYPSAIHTVAKYIDSNKITLKFKPDAICTTAERLTEEQRLDLERVFGCRVFNQYAFAEGGPFITECTDRNMHLNYDSGIFELSPDKSDPNVAELVVTSFRNLKTPIIRYKTGDYVKLPLNDSKCSCGCAMPYVSEIFGRIDDLLVHADGSKIGMVSYRVFKFASNILKAQIIQKSISSFVINIEPDKNFNKENELFIRTKMNEIFGDTISMEIVKRKIQLGPNGKFKSVICGTKS